MSRAGLVGKEQYERESKEVFSLWARLARSKVSTVQKYYETWYETIVRELYTGGVVYLPKMGWILLKERKNSAQKQLQPDGSYKYYEVPSRDLPVFYPEDDFICDVNMKGITTSWRWRQKYGKTSWRDKEREELASKILEIDYQDVDTIKITPKIRELIHKSKFKEILEKKRNEYEAALFASINEVKNEQTE